MSNFLSNQLRHAMHRDDERRCRVQMIAERQVHRDRETAESVIRNCDQAKRNLVRMTKRIHDDEIRSKTIAAIDQLVDELQRGMEELNRMNGANIEHSTSNAERRTVGAHRDAPDEGIGPTTTGENT